MSEGRKSFHEKVAWVTGASRGIGRAIALNLARAGAVVVAGARSEDQLRQLKEVGDSQGLSIQTLYLDVSDPKSVEQFATAAREKFGPPSILINNAGMGIFEDIETMSVETFDKTIDVTLKGPWYMTKAAVPMMRQLGGGKIVNISSIAGKNAFKRGAAYNASKAGLNLMSEALMLELREDNISVVVIAPGSVDTRFHSDALPAANAKDQSWMLTPETLADSVHHVLTQPENTLTNYYEIRPLQPPKK